MDLILTATTPQAGIQREVNSIHCYRQPWCPSSVFKHRHEPAQFSSVQDDTDVLGNSHMLCTPSLKHFPTLPLKQFHGSSDCIAMALQTFSMLVSVTQLWPSLVLSRKIVDRLVFPLLGDCFRLHCQAGG